MLYKFGYSTDQSMHGYIESSLSYFDARQLCNVNSTRSFCSVDECRYLDYRNPPCSLQPGPQCDTEHGVSLKWWHVLAARLAFILVFEVFDLIRCYSSRVSQR